jgi:hypothetical protein
VYQTPKLNVIGDAREVILGYVDTGADLDNTHFYRDWEYGQGLPPIPPSQD